MKNETMPASDERRELVPVIIASIVVDTLKSLKMAYPKTTARRRRELRAIRKQLKKN